MKKYTYCIVLLLTALLISQEAFSQPLGRGMGRGVGYPAAGYYGQNIGQVTGYRNPYCQLALNLTPEQVNEINALRLQFQKENSEIMNKLYQCRLDLRSMRFGDTYDETAVNAKIDEFSKIQAQLQKKMLADSEKIKNILTKEQKALLGNTGLSFGLLPNGRGIGCLGFGPGTGRGFGAGMGMGRRGMMGRGRGPCGMGIGRGARQF